MVMHKKSLDSSRYFLALAVFAVLFIRLLYILSFPLNFSGDASVYYTMIMKKHSHLLLASGYPFLMMWPYHFLRQWVSGNWGTNENPQWWKTHETALLGSEPVHNDFLWSDVFQNHDFILFQHSIELLSLFCGFLLARRYFGNAVAILFLVLYGISPLSLEEPSSTLPEWLQGAFLVFWVYFAEKIRRVSSPAKIFLYLLLGALAALSFVIKFNSLPISILFFICLFLVDRERWTRTLSKIGAASTAFVATLAFFILSFHLPTTGTTSLTMNSWILATKCFEFIPHESLRPEFGIHTKRVLAILSGLPEEHPVDRLGPNFYFKNVDAVRPLREPYRKNLLWLMKASDPELDSYLSDKPSNAFINYVSFLRISYYLGLSEYSSLLKNMYVELIKKFPVQFVAQTLKTSIQSFGIKDKSSGYRPLWNEVAAGSNPKEKSRLGYVRFLWPEYRIHCNVYYHTHVVWLPGLWFFTRLHELWPPLWSLWILAFIALAISAANYQKNRQNSSALIVIGLMVIFLTFVGFSNCIMELCRIKDYRCIHLFVTMLAAVGLYQAILLIRTQIRKLFFNISIAMR
jgi:hypothetical protein